nr:cytochrome b6/f complex subunit VIII [Lithothamnion corallioides]WEA77011.1 cytochrome b6/f complex subunit VIII [Lithothamnion corallioides]
MFYGYCKFRLGFFFSHGYFFHCFGYMG